MGDHNVTDQRPVLARRKKSSCVASEQIQGSPGDRYYMMLRWSTAAAACLLLGGVRGAVMASSEEEAKSGEAERRSLKMTKEGSLEKMLFDFTDPALFGE